MTLAATLNSVLGQTHTVWEAVIVDDGSTGTRTNTTAEDWAHRDRRFRALHQQQCGVSAARNSGLQVAQYPFVLFLDSDDRIAPTHLECMAAMLLADDLTGCRPLRLAARSPFRCPRARAWVPTIVIFSSISPFNAFFLFMPVFCDGNWRWPLVASTPPSLPAKIGTSFNVLPEPEHASGVYRRSGPLPSPCELRQPGQSTLPDRCAKGTDPRPWTRPANVEHRSSSPGRTEPCLP